jgi:hypothetical protein
VVAVELKSDPDDLELDVARWGLRAFWFLGGVTATVIIGYGLVPAISNVAWIIAVALFVCAVGCVLIMLIRLVQYGLARRGFYQQVSSKMGSSYARELRRSEKPAWWNRLSPLGKIVYSIGVVAIALMVAILKPNAGDANLGARGLCLSS